jgi:uncharacterized protein (TIGR02996 family)
MAAKRAKPKSASKTKARDGDPFAAALAAVKANRLADALASVLAAWRIQPSDRLADLIETISTRVRSPSLVRGKTAVAVAAWNKLAATVGPHELPALLETVADVSSGDAGDRLAFLARFMPDPRIDAVLVDLLHAVPYRATATKPFWTKLFELAEGITDNRALVRLDTANADGVAATMATWLRGRIATLRENTAWKRNVANDAPAIVDQIADLLGPRKLSVGSLNIDALLQAICDSPDDDAPRLVYADALQERGNPRGEFIARSVAQRNAGFAPSREGAVRTRQAVGDLAVIAAGFGRVVAVPIDNRHLDRVRKLVSHPTVDRAHRGSALIAPTRR